MSARDVDGWLGIDRLSAPALALAIGAAASVLTGALAAALVAAAVLL